MSKVTCLMLAALLAWSGLGGGAECLTVERMLWEDYRFGLSKAHVMLGDFAACAVECLAGLRVESVDLVIGRVRGTSHGWRFFFVEMLQSMG